MAGQISSDDDETDIEHLPDLQTIPVGTYLQYVERARQHQPTANQPSPRHQQILEEVKALHDKKEQLMVNSVLDNVSGLMTIQELISTIMTIHSMTCHARGNTLYATAKKGDDSTTPKVDV